MTGQALRAVARHPLRSVLAILGLVVGVGSVVTTMALLAAAHRQGIAVLEASGALDVVRLSSPGVAYREGTFVAIRKRARLGAAEAGRLRAAIPWVVAVTPVSEDERMLSNGEGSVQVTVRGVWAEAPRLLSLRLLAGRFLSAEEAAAGDEVAVLSGGLAADLFGGAPEALGREVRIEKRRFLVVGVLVPVQDERGNERAACYVGLRAATERLGTAPAGVAIHLAAGRRDRVSELESAVKALLPGLQGGVAAEAYEVDSSREALEELETAERTQRSILGGIAALSLLVAASGVFNTLLVGVRERTREIGTRRALGARRRSILGQFLLEALLLSLPGAVLGLAAGIASTRALGSVFRESVQQPVLTRLQVGAAEAIAAVALSILVALAAGLWPAWQAARVEPAEALRWE